MRNLTLLILLTITVKFFAQENPRNTGLDKPQAEFVLPKSKAEVIWPEKKLKTEEKSKLVSVGDNAYTITNGWELIEAEKTVNNGAQLSSGKVEDSGWYNAVVPGTVLTTLVDNGVYPNPYFGINILVIPDDLCRKDWWYKNAIEKPQVNEGEKVWLILNGINYEANVWFNGKLLGTIKGAFIRGEFDVTELIQEKNNIAIRIIPPPHPGIPHEQSALDPRGPNGGQLCQDGPTFISSEGWDWVPGIRDRNIGIWQDVQLKITGAARIIDPQVITDLNLPDTSLAKLTIKTVLESDITGSFIINGNIGDISFSKEVKLVKGSNKVILKPNEIKELNIKKPKLWWPNGYGNQNLYYLKLELTDANKKILDKKTVRFGIREMSYDFAVSSELIKFQRINFNPINAFSQKPEALFDNINRTNYKSGIVLPTLHKGVDLDMFEKINDDNPYLVINVNGVSIFCKGGNWGMDDAMKRVSRERLGPYFKLHKEANYTMIRNWTGESTEETFYELADEYGMLIWNDFWMSTEGYNMPPADFDLFMKNATDVVKRFRNHPSIAIWCSRNEGYAPKGLDKPLGDLIAKEDGTRMYQSNSRYLNLRPSGPWDYKHDLNYYFAERAEGFSTEVGTHSFPTVESLKAMMPEEDVWPISDAWYYHDLHTGHQNFRASLIYMYGEAFTLEDFIKKAQMLNYRSHRAIFEAWNSKLWDNASGILLWMTHPAWPSMIWQTYSSDYETYGAYFGAKKACEPIHIQLNNNDNKVIAVNTSLKSYTNAKAVALVYDFAGNELQKKDAVINSNANSKEECFIFEAKEGLPSQYLIRLKLFNEKNILLSENAYWKSTNWSYPFLEFNLIGEAAIEGKGSVKEDGDMVKGTVSLKNTSDIIALSLKMNLRAQKSGERILPVYFNDGYFDILPGEEKQVSFECPKAALPKSYNLSVEGYNLKRTMPIKF